MAVELQLTPLGTPTERLATDHPLNLFRLRAGIALAEGRRLDLVDFDSAQEEVIQIAQASLSTHRLTCYSEGEIDEDLTTLVAELTGESGARADFESSLCGNPDFHERNKDRWERYTLRDGLVIGAEIKKDRIGWRHVTWYVRGTKHDDQLSICRMLMNLLPRRLPR
jgi:hypothetical protein